MKSQRLIQGAILWFWTLFWGLSVADKILPDVQHLWVGKDFFALFVKFFASMGLKDPAFATAALAAVSGLEAIVLVLHATALIQFLRQRHDSCEAWYFRAAFGAMGLFALFSIADQAFGDRFQLLEHGLFWLVLLASWLAFRHLAKEEVDPPSLSGTQGFLAAVVAGVALTLFATWSIRQFSASTFELASAPVPGTEVVEGVWKFDFPFLADKLVWEQTIEAFRTTHPDLDVTYIYTGPSELNSKKKTHLLLYVFTEPR